MTTDDQVTKQTADEFATAGFAPADALPFRSGGFTAEEAARWRAIGVHGYAAQRWRDAGVSAETAAPFVAAGFDSATGARQARRGIEVTDAITELLVSSEADRNRVRADAALRDFLWEVRERRTLADRDLFARAIADGLDLATVKALEPAIGDVRELLGWASQDRPAVDIAVYRAAGISADLALRLEARRYDLPWVRAWSGIPVGTAMRCDRAGFTPESVRLVGPEEALGWLRAAGGDADLVVAAEADGLDRRELRRWRTRIAAQLGIEPAGSPLDQIRSKGTVLCGLHADLEPGLGLTRWVSDLWQVGDHLVVVSIEVDASRRRKETRVRHWDKHRPFLENPATAPAGDPSLLCFIARYEVTGPELESRRLIERILHASDGRAVNASRPAAAGNRPEEAPTGRVLRYIHWGEHFMIYDADVAAALHRAMAGIDLRTWSDLLAGSKRDDDTGELLAELIGMFDTDRTVEHGLTNVLDFDPDVLSELLREKDPDTSIGEVTVGDLLADPTFQLPIELRWHTDDGEPQIVDPMDPYQMGVPLAIIDECYFEDSNMVSHWDICSGEKFDRAAELARSLGYTFEEGDYKDLPNF